MYPFLGVGPESKDCPNPPRLCGFSQLKSNPGTSAGRGLGQLGQAGGEGTCTESQGPGETQAWERDLSPVCRLHLQTARKALSRLRPRPRPTR